MVIRFVVCGLAALAAVLPGSAAAPRAEQKALSVQLDERLREMESRGFSGVVIASRGSGVLLHRGYGFADRATNVPNGPDTIVNLGSIVKQFTAAAVLRLQERGRLHVDAAIGEYLPDAAGGKEAVTIHQLLSHTSGLPDALGFDWTPINRAAFLRAVWEAPVAFEPGLREEYSNVGYSLLAAIVEEVSGKEYERFVEEELFAPAGMRSTGYRRDTWRSAVVARGYSQRGTSKMPGILGIAGSVRDYWHVFGNGEMLSTAEDMLRWHRALEGTQLLSAASKRLMFPDDAQRRARKYTGYGGFMAEARSGGPVVIVNGGNPYFSNEMRRYLSDGTMLYVALNTKAFPLREAMRLLEDVLYPAAAGHAATPHSGAAEEQ